MQHFLQKHSLSLSVVFPPSLPSVVCDVMLSTGSLHWSCGVGASSATYRKSSNDDPKAKIQHPPLYPPCTGGNAQQKSLGYRLLQGSPFVALDMSKGKVPLIIYGIGKRKVLNIPSPLSKKGGGGSLSGNLLIAYTEPRERENMTNKDMQPPVALLT